MRPKNKKIKKMKLKLNLTILFVIICIISIQAQTNKNTLLKSQNDIEDWLKEYNVPAIGIGLIKDGKLSEYKVFGEIRKDTPAKDNTVFSIASVTKTITTAVILKLIEDGILELDEPLYKYWIDPDIADNEWHKKLTARNILSHQSGLPNWRTALESKKLEFQFEPGTGYNYSGEGFEYLRKAVENKLNKSFEEISDSILFHPIQMSNTKFRWKKEIDSSVFAFRHDSEGKEYKYQGGFKVSAAAGILTTIKDYAKFCIYIINKAGLSDSLSDEMISTQASIKDDIDQGLGWQIVRNLPNNEYALMHEGGEWGISTIAIILPKSKSGIIIFTNSDEGHKVYTKITENYLDHGKEIFEKLNEKSYDPESIKIVQVSPKILQNYIGSYYIGSFNMSVDILIEDNEFILKTPYNTMELYAQSTTKFFLKDDDFRIEFIKDKNEVSGITVIYHGGEPEFAKKNK